MLGVPVRLHFTFVLLLIGLVVIGLSSNQSPGNYTLFVLAVIASVLLHELGHAFVSSLYGIRTLEIVMYPIGGVARLERPPKPWEEFWIALTGPAVNLAIAVIIFAILYSQKRAINLFALAQPAMRIWPTASRSPISSWPDSICCPHFPWTAGACCAPFSRA